MVMTARHLAKRAPELVILGEALAQSVEAFGHRLDVGVRAGERLGAAIDLDAGDRPGRLHDIDQRRAVLGLLADRLVVEDDAGDVVLHPLAGAEQHLAIVAARILGGRDADGIEALLDRPGAFVGGKDALARCNERFSDFRKLFSHGQPLVGRHQFAAEHLAPNRRRGQPQGHECRLSPHPRPCINGAVTGPAKRP